MPLKNKLKSTSGESIAEVLVAMLVVALGSVLFVTMVMASRNIIQKSEDAYDLYIQRHNALETKEGINPDKQQLEIKSKDQLLSGSVLYQEEVNVYAAENDKDFFTYEAE